MKSSGKSQPVKQNHNTSSKARDAPSVVAVRSKCRAAHTKLTKYPNEGPADSGAGDRLPRCARSREREPQPPWVASRRSAANGRAPRNV